jgi:hypothetical protein
VIGEQRSCTGAKGSRAEASRRTLGGAGHRQEESEEGVDG